MSRFVLCLLVIVALLGVGWQADALVIGLVGPTSRTDPVGTLLSGAGHSITADTSLNDLAAATNLSDFDTIVVMRTAINDGGKDELLAAMQQSPPTMLVTDHGFVGVSPTVQAIRPVSQGGLGLSPGTTFTTTSGFFNGEVQLTGDIGDGFDANPYQDGTRTHEFLQYSSIGGTLIGDGIGGGNNGGIIEDGASVLIGYSWSDDFGDASHDTQQLILNAVALNKTPGPGPGVIPEPSTLALFSIAILGVLGYGWRRRNQGSDVDNAA